MRSDGSALEARQLHAGVLTGAPKHWSAADELLFIDAFQANIFAIPVATAGEVRDVVVTEDAEYDPALSPNGRWLAYASNRTGETEVWVKGYPDGAPRARVAQRRLRAAVVARWARALLSPRGLDDGRRRRD